MIEITESGRQDVVFAEERMTFFLRWIRLSIHGGVFVGMNDELVFAMDTLVDSWRSFRKNELIVFAMDTHPSTHGGVFE